MQNILPLWKPLGLSTHVITKKVSEKLDMATAHTGTLDPMAEGVIIVLVGPERLNKEKYAEWKKEYIFELVLGASTDTFDGLGIMTDVDYPKDFKKEVIESVLSEFIGDYTQKYPEYSAKKIKGKPLHWYARNKKLHEIEIPEISGNIFDIELVELQKIPLPKITQTLMSKIGNVTGDLRQKEIIAQWKKFQRDEFEDTLLTVAKIRVVTSKGLYVRGLARDIGKKLKIPVFVYSLIRTKNGDYTEETSKTLKDFFGSNFMNKYDFASRGNA